MKKILKFVFIIIIITIICFGIFQSKNIILKNIYKIKYIELVEEYSKEYDVDKYLILACIKAESNFKEDAISKKGAKGLMQLMDSTAEELAKSIGIELNENDIFKPEININLGTKYISSLLKKYENIELALAAYNAGKGKVDNWIKDGTLKEDGSDIENIPYKETKNYVRKILNDYEIYKKIYVEEG